MPHLDLGLHFCIRINEPELSPELRAALLAIRPVAIQFGSEAFLHEADYDTWLTAFSRLYEEARSLIGREKLLVTLDHEGGRVIRPPAPITKFPYAFSFRENAEKVGVAMAKEVRSLGVNMVFAPVLDIHSNAKNPVIGERAFGRSADEVIKYAIPFLEALKATKILSCGKHFPGHGDTDIDSHLALPELRLSLDELRARELLPFRKAIASGVPAIMTSHIMFPKIDSDLPATLSKKIVTDILRHALQFSGVIFSDDLDMKAIMDNFSDALVARSVVEAGCDILLFNYHPDRAQQIFALIKEQTALSAHLVESENRIRSLLGSAQRNTLPTRLASKTLDAHRSLLEGLQ